MKFCRPVLRAAQKAIAAATTAGDGEGEENIATSIYKRHRLAFHPIARRLIEKACSFIYSIYEMKELI